MKKHFVTFLSPGTFVHEESELPIDAWDVSKACDMAHGIKERHAATPFAFYFTTRERKDNELDSRVVKRSGRYFLGGAKLSLQDVNEMNRKEPGKYNILRDNMRFNHWKTIIQNDNSWRIFQPLEKDDTLLDWKPKKAA